MRLHEFFKKYARGRGVQMAEQFAENLREVLSVQAPTRISRSGRVYAATPAIPGAPPRRVTGALQKSVSVIRTKNGASVQVYKFYGAILEEKNHPFFAKTLKKMKLPR